MSANAIGAMPPVCMSWDGPDIMLCATGDVGADAMADALRKNAVLTQLALCHNGQFATCAWSVCAGIDSNDMSAGISACGLLTLESALSSNTSITCLNIQGNAAGESKASEDSKHSEGETSGTSENNAHQVFSHGMCADSRILQAELPRDPNPDAYVHSSACGDSAAQERGAHGSPTTSPRSGPDVKAVVLHALATN